MELETVHVMIIILVQNGGIGFILIFKVLYTLHMIIFFNMHQYYSDLRYGSVFL